MGDGAIIKRLQTIDAATGVVLYEVDSPFSPPFDEEARTYRFPSHKAGARMFSDVLFPDGMTAVDIGRMTIICRQRLIDSSNILGYRSGKRIVFYTAAEIAGFAGLGVRRGKTFMAKMQRLNIIHKTVRDGQAAYIVNPAYFMVNGQPLTLEMYLEFQDYLWPLLPRWVIDKFVAMAPPKKEGDRDVQVGSLPDSGAQGGGLAADREG